MALSKNKQVASEFMTSLETDDIDRLRSCISDDMAWWLPQSLKKALGFPDAVRGKEAIVTWLYGLNTSLYKKDENKKFIIHDLVEDGDKVAVQWTLKTETPAGKPYSNDYIYLCRIKGNQVVEQWTYTDTAHAYEELMPKSD